MRALSVVFTLYGLSVCWAPYIPVWQQRELGFSAVTVGAVQAGICVALAFAVPVFCAALDALGGGIRAEIFTAAVFISNGAMHAVYPLMPNVAADKAASNWAFTASLLAIVVAEMLRGACGAMLDVACLQKLGPEHRLEYGRIRLWISLMWGGGASAIGVIRPSPLSLIFVLSPFFSVCLVLFYSATLRSPAASLKTSLRPPPMESEGATAKAPDDVAAPSYVTRLRCFIRDSDWRAGELVIVFFLLGTARRTFETFVYLLLDDLGGGTQLMGLATLVQVVAEIPAYFFFAQISALLGSRGVLYLSASCYAVRATWYAHVRSAWAILVVEPLHGITFALLLSSVVTITADAAPPGLQGTAQGVLARGVFDGAGGILGSAAGGVLFSRSPSLLFNCVTVLALTACGVMAATDLLAMSKAAVKADTAQDNWWVRDGLALEERTSTRYMHPSSRAASAHQSKVML
jgi:hypothetical protein